MGWDFFNDRSMDRKRLVAYLRSPERIGDAKMIRSRVVGNHHWYVVEDKAGRWIGLDLMQGGGRNSGWGYKAMDESVGPCYYDCPLSYLDLAPQSDVGYSAGWRDKVRAHHASKIVPSAGLKVQYGGHEYKLLEPVQRKGWRVMRSSDGAVFRMQSRQLSASKLVAAS